ncbi:MAG: hypothetical protein ACJ8AW_45135 [Rhodopila sp.]
MLLTADGCGTMELTRRTGMSKISVWRWQDRCLAEGLPGLLRGKTCPCRIPSPGAVVEARMVHCHANVRPQRRRPMRNISGPLCRAQGPQTCQHNGVHSGCTV